MFEVTNANQRRDLIRALRDRGLEAREHTEMGGHRRVVVPLLDNSTDPIQFSGKNPEVVGYVERMAREWPHAAYLYIATGSRTERADVLVVGKKGDSGEIYKTNRSEQAENLDDVLNAFQTLWEERDGLLSDYANFQTP